MDAVERRLAELTRAVRQLGLKLNQVAGATPPGAGSRGGRPAAAGTESGAPSGGSDDALEALFDLLDGLSAAEVARRRSLGGRVRHRLGRADPAARGLRIARELAVERLAGMGWVPVRDQGVVDPHLHRVVHTLATRDPARQDTIQRCHRGGWIRAGRGTAGRVAHVTAWVLRSPEP